MQRILSQIASEHARMRRVLMLVDDLCGNLEATDQKPDSALFTTLFDYIDLYMRTHNPKEQRYLFRAVRARNPEAAALLDDLESQHREEPEAVARLRPLLSECGDGSPAARQALIEALGAFCQLLQRDMLKEETELLPMAEKCLTAEDWDVVERGYRLFDRLLDPVKGETFESEVEQLHSRLILYAPAPIGMGLTPPADGQEGTEAQALRLDSGLANHFGHLRALCTLSREDWQAINEQYLHYDDANFGAVIKDELRQLQTRLVYDAPTPIGLGMERAREAKAAPAADQVLAISELTTHYGRIQALNGISLRINKGELVALVGSNGAGKTTLLRTICGLQPTTGGRIEFNGQDISRVRADRRVRMGIALIPEGRQVFAPMSVEDNLLLGAYSRPRDDQVAADLDQMYRLFPILKQKRKQAAGTLSGGQQQMLAMARALMARPELLLLDEPSMGLAPILVEEIFNTIGELKSRGITILLIEQNAAAALNVANRGYVIETGNIVLSGRGRDLLDDERVRQAYLGK